MLPTTRFARLTGVLYLLSSVPAVFCYQYVPSKLIVSGDAVATSRNILQSEMLFRCGIFCELVTSIAFIFVVRALWRLLEGVDKPLSSLMVTLFVVSVPVSLVNTLNEFAALILLHGKGAISAYAGVDRYAVALFFLQVHGYGVLVAAVFWGIWLFPFGLLVFRSGFLPKVLGVLLVIGGISYVADSVTWFLFPSCGASVGSVAGALEAIGELPIIAWLIIKGVSIKRQAAFA